MKKLILLVPAIVLLALSFTPPTPLQAKDVESKKLAEKVLAEINKIREEEGLAALKRQPDLDKLAQDHAASIAKQEVHTDNGFYLNRINYQIDGSLLDRAKSSPYKFFYIGENVGMGGGGEQMAKGWCMQANSPDRKNIMDANYTEIGLGVARFRGKNGMTHYVAVFGRPKGKYKTDN